MKFVTATLTGVGVLFVAGSFFPGRHALGQPAGEVPANRAGLVPSTSASPYLYLPPGHPDPDQMLLDRELTALLKDYMSTENEEKRTKAKAKIGDTLGKQFDLQQKRSEAELAILEAQVKKLRDIMKKRNDARTTIVEKRMDQLLREADGLGWPTPTGPSTKPGAASFFSLRLSGAPAVPTPVAR